MITGHVFIATSLDGFVARKNHQLDWLMKQKTSGEDHGYDAFIDGVDGIVMGRGSFETVLGFGEWPYQRPVFVMSRTMTQDDIPVALQGKVRITNLEPREVMRLLESEGWSRVYVDGGNVVQSFIRDGLIRDIILTLIPILIGDGIRLFGSIDNDVDLELIAAKSFASGLVTTHYRVMSPDA